MDKKYDVLKIENQLCFPLYACSREIIKQYKPYLDSVDLTYTQYITMLILWEQGSATAKELGERLYLDSGTLTPVLKHLESLGIITRRRCPTDERVLLVTVTEEGLKLRERAAHIPCQLKSHVNLDEDEAKTLYQLLYKLLNVPKED